MSQTKYDLSKVTARTMPEQEGTYQLTDDYSISLVGSGKYCVLSVPYELTHPGSQTEHANIARSSLRTFEYKHTTNSGHKYWTQKDGREFYLIIPREQIRLYKECGYSYPVVYIMGDFIVTNTSGGTHSGGLGWYDIIDTSDLSTLVNINLDVFSRLLEVAVHDQEVEEQLDISLARRRIWDVNQGLERWDIKHQAMDAVITPATARDLLSCEESELIAWTQIVGSLPPEQLEKYKQDLPVIESAFSAWMKPAEANK